MIEITDPTLVLNEERCKKNIHFMAEKARHLGLKLRPHFKTHQSQEVGKWFQEAGVSAITVSSIGMANYFAEAGWKEITIAFPANIRRIDAINQLAGDVALNLLADNLETLRLLEDQLTNHVNVFIEIDSGSNRSGIPYNELERIETVAKALQQSKNLTLKGCYSHAGHTYSARSREEIISIGQQSLKQFMSIKNELEISDLEFCWGDTPSCSILNSFEGADALSPGNFVFYDVMQHNISSCEAKQVAVAMYCPVVSKKYDTNELVVHGGAVHFSKDSTTIGQLTFGQPIEIESWEPLPNSYVRALSQEHGIIKLDEKDFQKYNVGDVIGILPVHSCLTAQCMGQYTGLSSGQRIDHYAQKNRG